MTNMSDTAYIPDAPPPPKKPNWKVIIPIIIVVVLICICLVIVGVLGYMGTQGNGPFSFLATATPTRTPTRTPSPTPELSVLGSWNLYYDWGCDGEYGGPAYIEFYSDYTYSIYEGSSDSVYGTWYLTGDYIDFVFDDEPFSNYVGTVYDNSYMEGTMDNTEDSSGCWYAER